MPKSSNFNFRISIAYYQFIWNQCKDSIETFRIDLILFLANLPKISFNFGPTLLSWLEKADPDTYQSILDADRQSQEQFDCKF